MEQPKIYSKTGRLPHSKFKLDSIRPLRYCEFKPKTIYYYQVYDCLNNDVQMTNCLEEENWLHFKLDKTTRFVYENTNETFDSKFVNELALLIKLRDLPLDRVYVIVVDDIHAEFLRSGLARLGIVGINIAVTYQSIVLTDIPEPQESTHKFCCLSRNYRPWRLGLFAELVNRDLIKDFVYSFHNIQPYGTITQYSLLHLARDLNRQGIDPEQEPLASWLKGVPYDLDARVDLKFHKATYTAIQQADINLVVESKFNPNEYRRHLPYSPEYQPVFLTEKTFKAIACARPFIMYSVPGSLKAIQSMGFKTYHGLIDETYDSITDNQERHRAVISEIDRICNMPKEEYKSMIAECRSIAEFNLQAFKDLKGRTEWTESNFPEFLWLNAFKLETQK
jgi:hypothetical protein